MAMSHLFSESEPYVHSNYFLFSNNLRQELYIDKTEQGITKMQEKILQLTQLRDQLKTKADDFLMGKTPKEAFNEINNAASLFSSLGREVVSLPQGREYLTKETYSQQELQRVFNGKTINEIANLGLEGLDINQIDDIIK